MYDTTTLADHGAWVKTAANLLLSLLLGLLAVRLGILVGRCG